MTSSYNVKYKVGERVPVLYVDKARIAFYNDREINTIEIRSSGQVYYYLEDGGGLSIPCTQAQIDAGIQHANVFKELWPTNG